MIIGLTGPYCAGTDTVGEILVEKGFVWYAYSDILRDELKKRNIEITRATLQDIGDELRKKHGPGFLSKLLLEKINYEKKINHNVLDFVVGNMRNPGEVAILKEAGNFNNQDLRNINKDFRSDAKNCESADATSEVAQHLSRRTAVRPIARQNELHINRDLSQQIQFRRKQFSINQDNPQIVQLRRKENPISKSNFILIKVDAEQKIRFERMQQRKRENDPQTFEDFLKSEQKDFGIEQESHGQQHSAVFALAEHTIINDSTYENLKKQVEDILEKIHFKK